MNRQPGTSAALRAGLIQFSTTARALSRALVILTSVSLRRLASSTSIEKYACEREDRSRGRGSVVSMLPTNEMWRRTKPCDGNFHRTGKVSVAALHPFSCGDRSRMLIIKCSVSVTSVRFENRRLTLEPARLRRAIWFRFNLRDFN